MIPSHSLFQKDQEPKYGPPCSRHSNFFESLQTPALCFTFNDLADLALSMRKRIGYPSLGLQWKMLLLGLKSESAVLEA